MAGQIPPPKSFPDWVKTILSFKAHWSFSEFAESWLNGARMLLDTGTTTVVDIESVPELPPEVWKSTALRVSSLYEMTGVKSQRPAAEILREAREWMKDLPALPGKETGLSPHALYSTTPELMQASAALIRQNQFLASTHLAESESEFQMFRDARGPFYDWLKGQRSMSDCGRLSPIQLADSYGLLSERLLAVHVNYLAPGDVEILARAGTTVVHCPRSHDYFEHDPFPFGELSKGGVNICLGTDSLASSRKSGNQSPTLNLWDEMRLFAKNHPAVSPRQILEMTTTHAAKALGKEQEIGSLAPGRWADCVALTYEGRLQEPALYEELLYAARLREVFIGGEQIRPA
jgi:cytosine/adenosine deaminase-related metal-dependent hydrolase